MQRETLRDMTPSLGQEHQALLNETLISEIKAEMGRRGLSSRGLGRLIGKSSQYVSWRLDGGNPVTGKRTMLTIWDIVAIASALDMEPDQLLRRAQEALPPLKIADSTRRGLPGGSDE